ncbi:Smr/MutS family protein [Lichenifustis flavocetrariae]|uniref:Smr/MutS family protein n=1 Tax=Lichenifustis flavocetrariae TaxID=2949735 RepID=A0AA41YZP5_9HYPH|nr:Smr/MutS family protein [Lichenifustis flavocetrariae]MCW6510192.1 Smr/MutS family protein [Lichenifustis flavocetrariae]
MKPPIRYRRLSDEEITLWRSVADTVERRPGSHLPEGPPRALVPTATPAEPEPAAPPAPGGRPAKAAAPRAAPPLADLDRRTRQKIVRGRIGIERAIDLHGLTQPDAHAALRRFLHTAYAEDLRLVLVVTGKGDRSRARSDMFGETGVLKRMVPHWLREFDLRPIVLGFEDAGLPHGGAGALYIRLRRRKAPG